VLTIDDCLCLDVETANTNFSSICQVGIARLSRTGVETVFDSLIDPQQPYARKCIEIHHLTEKDTSGAATFGEAYAKLKKLLTDKVVFTWRRFDAQAITAACADIGIEPPTCIWVDAHPLAYKGNPDLSHSMKLEEVCQYHGINITPHYALSDATATIRIVEKYLAESTLLRAIANYSYRVRVEQDQGLFGPDGDGDGVSAASHSFGIRVALTGESSVPGSYDFAAIASKKVQIAGSDQGQHAGQVVTITGDVSKPREDFAAEIALHGFSVHPNLVKKTTILLVGKNAGLNKIEKAQEYIGKGQAILIMDESEFRERFGLGS
jgi:DNA polymerase-3 subunit epsilon